jgi:hypothetical protein
MTRNPSLSFRFVPPLALAFALSYFGPVLSAFHWAPKSAEYQVSNTSEFFKNRAEPILIR